MRCNVCNSEIEDNLDKCPNCEINPKEASNPYLKKIIVAGSIAILIVIIAAIILKKNNATNNINNSSTPDNNNSNVPSNNTNGEGSESNFIVGSCDETWLGNNSTEKKLDIFGECAKCGEDGYFDYFPCIRTFMGIEIGLVPEDEHNIWLTINGVKAHSVSRHWGSIPYVEVFKDHVIVVQEGSDPSAFLYIFDNKGKRVLETNAYDLDKDYDDLSFWTEDFSNGCKRINMTHKDPEFNIYRIEENRILLYAYRVNLVEEELNNLCKNKNTVMAGIYEIKYTDGKFTEPTRIETRTVGQMCSCN